MSEAHEAAQDAPAPSETETVDIAEAAAPAEASPEPTPEGEGPPAAATSSEAPAATTPEERKPKSPVSQLQGRVGHLTKTLHEKDSELAELKRQNEAYQALLGQKAEGAEARNPEAAAPPRTAASPESPEFRQLVLTEAGRIAAQKAFDEQCNAIASTGKEKFGEAFSDGVANLNALGLMTAPLIQAAMATGAAPDVINALGSDVDEAARIAALPPVQMGVELAKLALEMDGKSGRSGVSRAPAPITPVGGTAPASTDVYDPNLSMDEYVRRRKAQGSRWAK